jgi:hypothetical protein
LLIFGHRRWRFRSVYGLLVGSIVITTRGVAAGLIVAALIVAGLVGRRRGRRFILTILL